MGVGSVACVPSQHIMERLSISETFRGGGNNNGKFNSKPLKVTERKMKMKVKREQFPKKTASKMDDFLGSEKKRGKKCSREFGCTPKEEIEEGELGEFIPEKLRKFELKSEIERGESPIERWRNGEVENGEFGWGKWRKDKGEFSSGRSRYDDVTEKYKKGETEKEEFGSWRGSKTELEKGWHKSVVVKDEYRHSKMSRDDSDKGWRYEREWTPNGKYAGEKDFSRNGNRHLNRFSRWETGQERNPRVGSKIVDEEGSFKNEHRNGKYYERECISGNRLKRHGNDFESLDRKHYGEYGDYSSSKNRRLSDDGSRSAYSEHYSRQPVERSNRNSSSSRNISSGRYTSRHNEYSLSSRVAYDKHGSSPRHSERSPRERARYTAHRDRSPVRRERSPYDRSHHYDDRTRSPSYSEPSPQDRARSQDGRDQTPNFLEHSLLDRFRPNIYRDANKKIGASEKRLCHRGKKGLEDELDRKDPRRRDSHTSARESQDRSSLHNGSGSVEKHTDHQSQEEEQSQHQRVNCRESPQDNGNIEELPSMEEDMDICDTPPHMPVVVDSTAGNWFYLDHFGVECGPSKLCDLKALVEEGFLVPDHLIKHLNSDRWIAVENAVSPLVTLNFSPIVSDTVTQLVSPPEASGNLLADVGETIQGEDTSSSFVEPILYPDACLAVSEYIENLHIDKRVGALLEGYNVIPGQELETVGEVLQMKFEHGEWEKWGNSEGSSWPWSRSGEQDDQKTGDVLSRYPGLVTKETTDGSTAPPDRDIAFVCDDSSDWFSGRWSCKGGDWKRDDEASQDGSCKKKFVLNDGYPLCQMPKSGYEDPRWHEKDELYCPSYNRRLDLPPWAFSLPDEWNDCNGIGRSSQPKSVVIRGAKGTMLPVVRINACVVKDRGSFVSETHVIVKGKDRYTSRSARPHSGSSDVKGSSEEGGSQSISIDEQASQGSSMSIASINIQKNRLFATENLKLHLGEWYYLDGAGHEQGPLSFSKLQLLADQGIIQKNSSVFRKIDRVWVPITSASETSELPVKIQQVIDKKFSDISGAALIESTGAALAQNSTVSSSFHSLHPQFIGFTRGKLHELVMKSYKSREFAAAINEVLDPWINAKQPKKDMEKYIHNPALYNKFSNPGKRARFLVDGSKEDYEMEEVKAVQEECTFDDLCSDAVFHKEDNAVSEIETGSWGLLDGLVLARVFHFLRTDVKSVVYAALTCKHWRAVSNFYKDITRQVDLSSVGPSCTDSMIWNIMTSYKEEKITSLVLLGCTNISSGMLEEIIRSFPSLSCIDIRGCNQFSDLEDKFLNINWVKSRGSHSKIRNLKHINEGTSPVFKSHNGLDTDMDDSSGLRDYFESLDRRDSANQLFHRSLYKRSKLLDARKSSSILSRNARLRRWAVKKSENGYKRMEEFLVFGLKDIMKENTFDFFVPKVAEIEDRMKNGYYAGRGLSTVKEDISRMCRDAIKAKNRGNTGDLNHIVTLFIRLATHLDDSYKSCHERDEMLKNWKADLPTGFWPTNSKYKNKLNKVTERKMIRTNGSSFNNGGSDYGEYASDREIRRRLSRLNKKSMVSRSETSDELDRSSEETKTDSESTSSDTDNNSDFRSESGIGESRGDGYFIAVDGLDSLTDDREWGARMTKASLVPPVTRKYEVIDRYVIVADDEEVKRKMRVSLPDDYDEKLSAQRNGTEESDMEIPEVKDYKPRKQLEIEVIEQEVYGIDPYTHNLLLDSMPEGSNWTLQDKHLFIEDVLLRSLNKQVRNFTGTGNTPMMYPLQPVVEEILKTAEEDHDNRTIQFCECILNAINKRPEDNYVAYRKGLGVVCNKEGGFVNDDFVVEFLGEVYPAWKWFEKQDGIRSLQKNNKDPAPEFYNIYLERPKGDADGYDLVVVDAMHKANYASRICHSCRPNCEAKVTAVDGQYQIGIYAVRPIEYGEEITFDYNSVTESKEEHEASVCLCGSQICRGTYLNLTGEGAFQKVLKEWHGILNRHHLLLEACEINFVSEEDYIDLGRAGLGSCLLGGLPDWLIAYSARLVRFINFERTKLPQEILKHNLEEKRKFFADISIDVEIEKNEAEVQAEGVYNQRLQNLALTLDKVRYVMRCVFGDPKTAPPPLERLSPEAAVSFLWKGEGSLVDELIQSIAPHMDNGMLNDLKSNIRAHDPSDSDDMQKELRKSLIWLRDEVRNLPCTSKCRHDAAADLIHIYAHTKCFFRVREYKAVTSPPVYISPLDLGPKYTDKMGSGLQEYQKTYGENYCLGQLICWHNQTNNAEPDCSLVIESRGCLSLPEIGSFYVQKPSRQWIYGPSIVKLLLARMEKQPQRPWPEDRIWSFKHSPKIFGSPMLDVVLHNTPLEKEMVHWLKNRPAIFRAPWDR